MDDLAQPQLAGGAAQQGGQFLRVVGHQSAGHRDPVAADQLDRISSREAALDGDDAGRQQRQPPLADCRYRAVVEDQPPAGGRGVGQPEQATTRAGPGRRKQRAALAP